MVRCGTKFELFHRVIFCQSTQTTLSDKIDSCQTGEKTTNAKIIDTNIKDESPKCVCYKLFVPKQREWKEKKYYLQEQFCPFPFRSILI